MVSKLSFGFFDCLIEGAAVIQALHRKIHGPCAEDYVDVNRLNQLYLVSLRERLGFMSLQVLAQLEHNRIIDLIVGLGSELSDGMMILEHLGHSIGANSGALDFT